MTHRQPPWRFEQRASELIDVERYDDAQRVLAEGLAQWPNDVGLLCRVADSQLRQRKFVEARQTAQIARRSQPDHWRPYNTLAAIELDDNRPAIAADHAYRACQLAPHNSAPLYLLGLSYVGAGWLDRACQVADTLIAREPASAAGHVVHVHVGLAKQPQAATGPFIHTVLTILTIGLWLAVRRADRKFNEESSESIRRHVAEATRLEPHNSHVQWLAARAESQLGSWDQGLDLHVMAERSHGRPPDVNSFVRYAGRKIMWTELAVAFVLWVGLGLIHGAGRGAHAVSIAFSITGVIAWSIGRRRRVGAILPAGVAQTLNRSVYSAVGALALALVFGIHLYELAFGGVLNQASDSALILRN